jgi:uncharacterized protein
VADGSVIQGGVVKLSFDGKTLSSDMVVAVTSVVVEQRLNMPASCTMVINPVDYDAKSYRAMDLDGFELGTDVSVSMGLNQAEPMFAGKIAAMEPILTATCRELEITAYDPLYQLGFGTKIRTFLNMTDKMMVNQILEDAGLIPDIEETEGTYPYVMQNRVSDYAFIMSRARRLGYEVLASGRTITFRASRAGEEPTVSLEYAVGLTEFRARMRALQYGGKVSRVGWDPKTKSVISATVSSGTPDDLMGGGKTGFQASSVFGSSATAGPDASITDAQIAHSLALGVYDNDLDNFLEGVGTAPGDPGVTPGVNVELTNIGAKFNGVYYVTGSRHAYDIANGYVTRFQVRRTGI